MTKNTFTNELTHILGKIMHSMDGFFPYWNIGKHRKKASLYPNNQL